MNEAIRMHGLIHDYIYAEYPANVHHTCISECISYKEVLEYLFYHFKCINISVL